MPKLFNLGTNKQGLIVYGGVSSADYGMVISEAPAYERPTRKQTVINVPGRSGSIIYQDDAWEDVTRSYNVWAAADVDDLETKVNAFEAVLNSQKGYVRLEDNFEPDFYRLAYYAGGDAFTNNMTQYGEATVNFICNPKRFYKEGEHPIEVVDGDNIVNPTRFTAKPLIYIEGIGTVTIAIGGRTLSAELVDYMTIDCETMNAYKEQWGGIELKNNEISGNFPQIIPGANHVGITGNVTKVEVTPRTFTI